MTAAIHPRPRARDRRPGTAYPAAFGSAAGPGFQWSVPTQPTRAASPPSAAGRIGRVRRPAR